MAYEKKHSDNISDKEMSEPVAFTAKTVRELLALGQQLVDRVLHIDPNVDRALQLQRDINKCLAPYEKLYKDLGQKQSLITDFIAKTPRTEFVPIEVTVEPDLNLCMSSDESD